MASPERLTIRTLGLMSGSWIGSWRCEMSLPKDWGALRAQRHFCTICLVTKAYSKQDCAYRAPHAPSIGGSRENGRIAKPLPRLSDPIERPKPMEHWQMDFKDASSVPADPDGKQQHVVETLNIIDMGTSVNIASHVRSDFTAETALRALAETFSHHGRPKSITLDRDTRLRLAVRKAATSLLP
jgi:hypothetical protein